MGNSINLKNSNNPMLNEIMSASIGPASFVKRTEEADEFYRKLNEVKLDDYVNESIEALKECFIWFHANCKSPLEAICFNWQRKEDVPFTATAYDGKNEHVAPVKFDFIGLHTPIEAKDLKRKEFLDIRDRTGFKVALILCAALDELVESDEFKAIPKNEGFSISVDNIYALGHLVYPFTL